MDKGEIVLYKNTDGNIKLDVQLLNDTVWLNRNQMADLFSRDVKTIGKHINNIFNEGELQEDSTVVKFATVQKEGGRQINRNIEHYNLDVIISVGYWV